MPLLSQRPKSRPQSDSFTVHGVTKPIVSEILNLHLNFFLKKDSKKGNNYNRSNGQNGDGLITAEEIRETMLLLGEPITQAELTEMVLAADLNGDGKILYSYEKYSFV